MNPNCPDCGTPLASGALAGLCPACLLRSGAGNDSVTQAGRPPFKPPSVADLSTLFPSLEILELIGKGGMGAVYKARQRQLDRFVALKVLPPAFGDDASFAERFAREARALAKLNHPGIVTLYEFGHVTQPTGPLFYILMEFVDGVNLRQLLSGGRISPREALAIVPQICDALQFAHDRGIVHRDIKPENLLIDRRGAVKVADFGLAKLVGNDGRAGSPLPDGDSPVDSGAQENARPTNDLTDAGKVMGTPRYMAPEQSERPSEVDHRADIYALGVVFYQMLTGELPAKELRPPSTKVQIDVRLDEIVLRALERNPSQRYAAVSEMKTQVEAVAGSREDRNENQPKEKLSPHEEPPTPQRRGTIGRALIWAIATFALTAGLAAVAGFWIDPIYASRSRVSVEITLPDNVLRWGTPSDFDEQWLKRVSSDSTLLDLASDLKLRDWLAQKTRGQLTTKQETLSVLRQSMEIKRSHAPAFFEIWTYDVNAANAASAADRIAELLTKRGVALTSSALDKDPAIANAQQTDKAIQPLRPVFPNWYAIISGCCLLSILTGLIRLRLTKTNLPPRNATLPDGGPVVAAALVAIWWFAAFPFVTFAVGSVRRTNALAIAAFSMALLLPFLWLLAKRQVSTWMTDDAGRLWMRAFAGVGWTFALPAVGFAMFFFHAFLAERGGWNPAPSEALIVPTIFLGAALLPTAATVLWGASGTSRRASLRMAFASSAATVALVLIVGGGTAALNRAELKQMRQAAEVTQANIESRAANPGDKQGREKSSTIASSGPAKVIVLTRATNNLVGTTKDTRTVGVWSDSLLLPGESLKASSERTSAGALTDYSSFYVMNQNGKAKTSTGLTWFFQENDGFGASEADEATAQILDRMTQRPLSLIPGSPMELFRVTNRHGSVIAGSVTFSRTGPSPVAAGKKVETTVHLKPVMGALLYINAEVPPGYRLQAADNSTSITDGQAHTSWPGVTEPLVSWFPSSQKFGPESRKTLFAQIEQLAARGPLTVVAGQPAEVFSITNKSGDVYKGFLELVGPKDGATSP